MLTLRISTDPMGVAAAPTIRWNSKTRQLTLTTSTKGGIIYYTTDGSPPMVGGKKYVPKLKGVYVDIEGENEDILQLEPPTDIKLPKSGKLKIRAFTKLRGLTSSVETVKEVNCGMVDMITGEVPSFQIGPRRTKGDWYRMGALGTILYRIHAFYSAPFTAFISDLIFTLTYVILYSYSCIVETVPMSDLLALNSVQTIIPFVVFIWTAMLLTDEIRQAFLAGLSEWWSSGSNKLDAFLYANSIVVVLLRLNYRGGYEWFMPGLTPVQWDNRKADRQGDRLHVARVLYAIGALLLWLRLGQLYALSQQIGPKLVMINKMMSDVMIFMCLLMVVLVGYGVAMHAIVEPWRGFDEESINTIFFKPMFHMIGETFLVEMQEHTDCLGEDFTQCNDSTNYIIVTFIIIYMIVTNIMLVNLLIAMMASTYNIVSTRTPRCL